MWIAWSVLGCTVVSVGWLWLLAKMFPAEVEKDRRMLWILLAIGVATTIILLLKVPEPPDSHVRGIYSQRTSVDYPFD